MTHKNIFIIRHGETAYNKAGIVQGCGVDTPLNGTGYYQAQRFYEHYKHISFDVVFTSALQRTHQSVSHFLQAQLPHIVLPELNEINWGVFEGKPQTADQERFYYDLIERWRKGESDAKVPQGESPIELQNRQRAAAQIILNYQPAENLLVCMHGRAMKSFLCLLLGLPLTQMETFQHSNLCLYQLQINGNGLELVKSNDITHLHI
jgi:broad specificity phosphatase PhoE